MDVSGEAADVVVKEGLQATETSVKLLATGMKNVAALLLAIHRGDYQVVGETNSKKLARDPTPATVLPLKREDIPQFQKLAKEYGVLYFFAQPKGTEAPVLDVVSNQNYAPQLNAVFQAMGYPLPEQQKEDKAAAKKTNSRAPQENSSKERGSGLTPSQTRGIDEGEKPSVKAHLEMLKAASRNVQRGPERTHEQER